MNSDLMSRHHAGGLSGPLFLMPGTRLALLVTLATLTVCACAPRTVEAPPTPSAAIQISGHGLAAGFRGRGQAVWIGNRILTAAHVLMPDYEKATLVSEVLLNGEPVRILDAASGDLDTVARLSSQPSSRLSEWLEDWVVAEVTMSAPEPIPLHICDRPVRPGDTLFAVGFPPQEQKLRLHTLPLTVLDLGVEGEWEGDEDTNAALEHVLAVRSPTGQVSGWSGSFVGRYDARKGQWCYIGLLVFSVDNAEGERVHFVLRPPVEALRLLME